MNEEEEANKNHNKSIWFHVRKLSATNYSLQFIFPFKCRLGERFGDTDDRWRRWRPFGRKSSFNTLTFVSWENVCKRPKDWNNRSAGGWGRWRVNREDDQMTFERSTTTLLRVWNHKEYRSQRQTKQLMKTSEKWILCLLIIEKKKRSVYWNCSMSVLEIT